MSEELSLEKLKIHERLVSVENHIIEGAQLRKELVSGFTEIKGTVRKLESTMYGNEDKEGVVHTMNDVVNLMRSAIGVLKWIAMIIGGAVIMYGAPLFFQFLAKATAHGQ